MKIIGLTGGIGTGKSTVSQYLKNRDDFTIIDADRIAHDIVEKGSPALWEIEKAFGSGVIDENGCLRRKALASIVFSDPEKRELLESITTNRIIEVINGKLDEVRAREEKLKTAQTALIDAPLLFESGFDRICDETWVVTASMEKRIERVKKRDNSTGEEIEARIRNQISADKAVEKAGRVLDNSGSLENLYDQIDTILG